MFDDRVTKSIVITLGESSEATGFLLTTSVLTSVLPSGKIRENYGKSLFLMGKKHYKWQFSTAMLSYQMVSNKQKMSGEWDALQHRIPNSVHFPKPAKRKVEFPGKAPELQTQIEITGVAWSNDEL